MIIAGTGIKINVHIDPVSQLYMDDYDFDCKFSTSVNRFVIFNKKDMVRIDEQNYYAPLDTSKLSFGKLYLEVTAYVPDADFESGYRKEKVNIDTGIYISK